MARSEYILESTETGKVTYIAKGPTGAAPKTEEGRMAYHQKIQRP